MKSEAESGINPDSLDSEWYVLIPTVILPLNSIRVIIRGCYKPTAAENGA
jgi:hypothetical protein